MIRAAVLVETGFYREGLAAALARAAGVSVVGQARERGDAVSLVRRTRPDVVLLDLGLAGRAEGVRAIATAAPAARVVALCVDDVAADIVPLAEAGITGYVTRDQSLDELLAVIRSVARNEMPCSPRVAAGLLHRVAALAASGAARDGAEVLTAREREIVELIRAGMSNREIGAELVIEVSTVKNHVHNILEKLHVGGRAEAVACVPRGALEGADP